MEKKSDDLVLKDKKDDDDDDKNNFGGNNVHDAVATLVIENDVEEGNLKKTDVDKNSSEKTVPDNSGTNRPDGVASSNNESMLSEDDDDLDETKMDTLLTESIRKSLEDGNSEVREAAHRLLRNRMVEVDRISERSGSKSGSDCSSSKKAGDGKDGGTSPDYGALTKASNEFHSKYTSMPPMGGDGAVADERTSLLAKSGGASEKSMGALNNFG